MDYSHYKVGIEGLEESKQKEEQRVRDEENKAKEKKNREIAQKVYEQFQN